MPTFITAPPKTHPVLREIVKRVESETITEVDINDFEKAIEITPIIERAIAWNGITVIYNDFDTIVNRWHGRADKTRKEIGVGFVDRGGVPKHEKWYLYPVLVPFVLVHELAHFFLKDEMPRKEQEVIATLVAHLVFLHFGADYNTYTVVYLQEHGARVREIVDKSGWFIESLVSQCIKDIEHCQERGIV